MVKRTHIILIVGLLVVLAILLLPRSTETTSTPTSTPVESPKETDTETQSKRRHIRSTPKARSSNPPEADVTEVYTLAGVVLDHNRVPRPEQTILLLVYTRTPRTPRFSWARKGYLDPGDTLKQKRRVITDSQGRFSVDIPQTDGVDLVVHEQGLSRLHLGELHLLDQTLRERLEVVVSPAGSIAGEVNRQSWSEVTGVELAGVKGLRFRDSMLFDSETGLFAFDDLPPGSYYVRLKFPRNADLKALGDAWLQEVHLSPGERVHVDFGFDLLLNLGGRVLLDGIAPADADLFLLPRGARNFAACRRTLTDDQGFFSFGNLLPGTYELVFPQTILTQYKLWNLIRLHPARETLTLVDKDLSKVFNFALQGGLSGRYGGQPDIVGFRIEGPFATPLDGIEVPVEGDGYFHFDSLPAGAYRLYALHESERGSPFTISYDKPRTFLTEVTIPPGGADVDLGDLELGLRAGLALVLHLENVAMPNHMVLYFWPGDEKNPTKSNALTRRYLAPQQEQVLEGLPAGHVRLGFVSQPATKALLKPYMIQLEPDREGKAHIFLSPPTTLLVDLAPGPMWRSILLSDENGRSRRTFRQVGNFSYMELGNGNANLEMMDRNARAVNLTPGTYQLSAFSEQGARISRDFTIGEGQTVSLTLQFEQL